MGRTLLGVVLGFIAGVLAFVTAHELLSQCLLNNGYITRTPWPMDVSPLTGFPQIATDAGIAVAMAPSADDEQEFHAGGGCGGPERLRPAGRNMNS